MSKLLLSFGLIISAGIIGISALVLSGSNSSNTATPESTAVPSIASNASSSPVAGSYIDYADDVIASTKATKLLFFHAAWCTQCQQLEKSITSVGVPDGVAIIKVNYDIQNDLRKKYGVTLQTTVVRIDNQGNLVKKFVAYDDPSIATVQRELL